MQSLAVTAQKLCTGAVGHYEYECSGPGCQQAPGSSCPPGNFQGWSLQVGRRLGPPPHLGLLITSMPAPACRPPPPPPPAATLLSPFNSHSLSPTIDVVKSCILPYSSVAYTRGCSSSKFSSLVRLSISFSLPCALSIAFNHPAESLHLPFSFALLLRGEGIVPRTRLAIVDSGQKNSTLCTNEHRQQSAPQPRSVASSAGLRSTGRSLARSYAICHS